MEAAVGIAAMVITAMGAVVAAGLSGSSGVVNLVTSGIAIESWLAP